MQRTGRSAGFIFGKVAILSQLRGPRMGLMHEDRRPEAQVPLQGRMLLNLGNDVRRSARGI